MGTWNGRVRDENIKKAFIQYLEKHPQERLFKTLKEKGLL